MQNRDLNEFMCSYDRFEDDRPIQNAQHYNNNVPYQDFLPKKKKFSFGKFIAIVVALAVFGSTIGAGYRLAPMFFDDDSKTKKESNSIEIKVAEKPSKQAIASQKKDLTAIEEIAEKYEPAIVSVVQSNPYSEEEPFAVIGTGIVFSEDNNSVYIVSNQHVVYDTRSGRAMRRETPLHIAFDDNNVCEIEVLGSDSLSDIAVMKVDKSDISKDFLDKLVPVTFADSDTVRVGEQVVAMGNPLGFVDTTTFGIVSALDRKMNLDVDFIQIDAAINSGNSGGATFNMKGEVIGINTIKIHDTGVEGLGFAVSSNDVKFSIEQIVQYGKVKRAFLGIQGQTVTNQQSKEFELPRGVRITKVYKNTGADISGILPGDVITAVNGKKIENMEELRKLIKGKKSGDRVELSIFRAGYKSFKISPVLKDFDDFEN